MLVLTRKPAETIRIGDDVVIKVIKAGRGAVKIGIDAPGDVRVLRGELATEEQVVVEEPLLKAPDPALTAVAHFPHAV